MIIKITYSVFCKDMPIDHTTQNNNIFVTKDEIIKYCNEKINLLGVQDIKPNINTIIEILNKNNYNFTKEYIEFIVKNIIM